ncbi:unnamed protein product [Citrullus colocynthis]|uniref:PABS domain-containing protein n=1 Tax=Citrullus colocynthis TaxID=252529 RepID=A0ABP0Z1T7_9ROSI
MGSNFPFINPLFLPSFYTFLLHNFHIHFNFRECFLPSALSFHVSLYPTPLLSLLIIFTKSLNGSRNNSRMISNGRLPLTGYFMPQLASSKISFCWIPSDLGRLYCLMGSCKVLKKMNSFIMSPWFILLCYCIITPKVFIMGGGEGSTARETLKHKNIEKVVMCDIDRDVVNFCHTHLKENQDAFQDKKLHIIFDDAKAGLGGGPEKFDVIIGDLSDPHEGGPYNHLYTKSFYEEVIKPKLNDNGIFVTQAGPAGILSHKVFSSIYNTVKHVFRYVIAYTAHVPSYADSCGWVLACDHPIKLDAEELNNRILINKTISTSMINETHVFTEEDARFAHGRGLFGNAYNLQASNIRMLLNQAI